MKMYHQFNKDEQASESKELAWEVVRMVCIAIAGFALVSLLMVVI